MKYVKIQITHYLSICNKDSYNEKGQYSEGQSCQKTECQMTEGKRKED